MHDLLLYRALAADSLSSVVSRIPPLRFSPVEERSGGATERARLVTAENVTERARLPVHCGSLNRVYVPRLRLIALPRARHAKSRPAGQIAQDIHDRAGQSRAYQNSGEQYMVPNSRSTTRSDNAPPPGACRRPVAMPGGGCLLSSRVAGGAEWCKSAGQVLLKMAETMDGRRCCVRRSSAVRCAGG